MKLCNRVPEVPDALMRDSKMAGWRYTKNALLFNVPKMFIIPISKDCLLEQNCKMGCWL